MRNLSERAMELLHLISLAQECGNVKHWSADEKN
jgi:hypothetical protein